MPYRLKRLKVFRALSAGTRFRILNLFLERECFVYEMVPAMRIPQLHASYSFGVLHNPGLLKVVSFFDYRRRQELREIKSMGGDNERV
jgi:predicted transcriptional regulator